MILLSYLTAEIKHRWTLVRDTKDAGVTTETVLITAGLAVLALAILAIIGAKLTSKATGINLGN